MPIYEYQCAECQYEVEVLQKMSDQPLVDCPDCGKPSLVKKISAAAFRLAGSGWYETDFKSGNKKNLAGDSANSDSTKGKNSNSTSNSTKTDRSAEASKSSPNSTTKQ